ncbi:hypothetical protein PDESU_01884 [Pontiella desulfatans]|uniref:Sodium/glucose cotransporter n=1 Tax=Pontiella desulfatans TaxID=2750659 RepID=A0A6C2U037_PONDE|nr:hypothetical protein [Pontiella desulfatans]VGO13328.1 hypothetical protein PDESU_01884 [Pontiella desulfatans]
MNLHWIDWTLIVVFLGLLTGAALFTRTYMRGVADFMAAGRCANRYLLTSAHAMSMLGLMQVVQEFQTYYEAGFGGIWWMTMTIPIGLAVSLSGWVVYRWRATRVLTQAQLFEMRYGKGYRIFTGIVVFATQLFGLSIFPTVATRFFVNYLGLPEFVPLFGFDVPTFYLIVSMLLFLALAFTFIGGQITVIVTDSMQAMFTMIVFALIFGLLLFKLDWSALTEGLAAAPENASKVNPFKMGGTYLYSPKFYFILAFYMIFIWPAGGWNQAATASAKTPHESRMSIVLSNVRNHIIYSTLFIVPIFAYALLHLPEYADLQQSVTGALAGQEDQVMRQIRVPVLLANFLPIGVKGLFAALALATFISTNNSYLLQFGGMFAQDVVLPLRKKTLGPKAHMRLLRISIVAVAVLYFGLSIVFNQKQDMQMFFALVWASVAGCLYIPFLAALYWKRGTMRAAWITAIIGLLLTFGAFDLVRNASIPNLGDTFGSGKWNEHTLYFKSRSYTIAPGEATGGSLVWRFGAEAYEVVDVPLEARLTSRGGAAKAEIDAQTVKAGAGTISILDPDDLLVAEASGGGFEFKQPGYHRFIVESLKKIDGIFQGDGWNMGFWIYLILAVIFIAVSWIDSLVAKVPEFNLDQLLHRGDYASEKGEAEHEKFENVWYQLFNITREFTFGDKLVFFILTGWGIFWFFVFVIGCLCQWLIGIPDGVWAKYFQISTYINFAYVLVGAVWLVTGALKNMKEMFRDLDAAQRDDSDDGMVG